MRGQALPESDMVYEFIIIKVAYISIGIDQWTDWVCRKDNIIIGI